MKFYAQGDCTIVIRKSVVLYLCFIILFFYKLAYNNFYFKMEKSWTYVPDLQLHDVDMINLSLNK